MHIEKLHNVDSKHYKRFFKSHSKTTLKSNFGPKFNFFFFDVDLSIFTNPKVVFSNMIITFSNYGLKLQKNDFVPQTQSFFVLHGTWHFNRNSIVLISDMIIVFSSSTPKITNKATLIPNLICFLQHDASHFHKFEGADFIYDSSFFYIWPNSTQIRHIVVRNLELFLYYIIIWVLRNS